MLSMHSNSRQSPRLCISHECSCGAAPRTMHRGIVKDRHGYLDASRLLRQTNASDLMTPGMSSAHPWCPEHTGKPDTGESALEGLCTREIQQALNQTGLSLCALQHSLVVLPAESVALPSQMQCLRAGQLIATPAHHINAFFSCSTFSRRRTEPMRAWQC
jgi:hypothetical protein